MRKLLQLITVLSVAVTFATSLASAANISITFINRTGQSISGLTAVPTSGGATIILSTEAIAAAPPPASVAITDAQTSTMGPSPLPSPPPPPTASALAATHFDLPDGVCIYTLSYTLASGQSVNLPDTDLCQTDQILIE